MLGLLEREQEDLLACSTIYTDRVDVWSSKVALLSSSWLTDLDHHQRQSVLRRATSTEQFCRQCEVADGRRRPRCCCRWSSRQSLDIPSRLCCCWATGSRVRRPAMCGRRWRDSWWWVRRASWQTANYQRRQRRRRRWRRRKQSIYSLYTTYSGSQSSRSRHLSFRE